VKTTGEAALARSRVPLANGAAIEKGTIAAQRITVAGMRDGRALLRFRANWYCSTDIDPAWELHESGWRVLVEGDTPLDVRMQFPGSSEDVATQMAGYTAHRAVNAISYVCAAAPGIQSSTDLPQIIAKLG
jgi:4-hydroxy-tetrahydrodipicolinate reductase